MESKETKYFNQMPDKKDKIRLIIGEVYEALKEKGYNPISQIVGYVVSGDPTYITNHNNARSLITRIDRDDLLEEVFKFYLENLDNEQKED